MSTSIFESNVDSVFVVCFIVCTCTVVLAWLSGNDVGMASGTISGDICCGRLLSADWNQVAGFHHAAKVTDGTNNRITKTMLYFFMNLVIWIC